MAVVKGSRHFEMRVVPHRPLYRVAAFALFLGFIGTLSWLTYEYGRRAGLAHEAVLERERDMRQTQLLEAREEIDRMRREIADLRLGGEVDSLATEEVRETIEELQERLAVLQEEITFYKGVMVPNVEDKGLRIERLNMLDTPSPNRFRYSLLLTQLVDQHDYVQGGVEINLMGVEDQTPRTIPIGQLDQNREGSIRFRFKYFQNIDGEMTLPQGFEPTEVMIVAQSSGRNPQRLERKFAWQLNGG